MTPLALRALAPLPKNTPEEQVVSLWLRRFSSRQTRLAYESDLRIFRSAVKKSLARVTLEDMQTWVDSLDGSTASKARRIGTVRSLFRFAHSLGFLPFYVAAAIRLPKAQGKLAKRILSEGAVENLLRVAEGSPRDHALLRLIYNAGLRVSEVVGLRWNDVQSDRQSAVLTVSGKGEKARTIRLSPGTWAELKAVRKEAEDEAYIFPGSWRRHGLGKSPHMDASAVFRIVQKYATDAGLKGGVSPHWLRHAHASHSIQRGAPIEVVRDTLGHGSLATTSRYIHARPNQSSGDFLGLDEW
jgi:site-specific recombinase XerD